MDENIKTTVDEGAKTASNSAADATPKQTKTAEELYAELLADNKRLKGAIDKATADASSWKKKYMETQSESEKLSMEKAERDAALKEELEALRRESKVNKYAKSFMSVGYSEEMATKAAEAQFDGDTDELFRIQKLYANETEKRIRAEIMKTMPTPATGNDDAPHITQEQFDKMTIREQTEIYEKYPALYEKLAK
jgi:hypothetical protein